MFGSFGNTDDLRPPFGHLEFEEFNSPPVVESADTGPFFHNHTVNDLESALAFYGTPAFQNSGQNGATPVSISADPDDPEVLAIAAFLRVLNALENIGSSINVAERGRKMRTSDDMRELAALSIAATIDAMQVLSGGALARHRAGHSVGSGETACGRTRARSGPASADAAVNRQAAGWGPATAACGAVGPGQSGHPAAVLPQLTDVRASHEDEGRRTKKEVRSKKYAGPQQRASNSRTSYFLLPTFFVSGVRPRRRS
jgi:hypothetical protein